MGYQKRLFQAIAAAVIIVCGVMASFENPIKARPNVPELSSGRTIQYKIRGGEPYYMTEDEIFWDKTWNYLFLGLFISGAGVSILVARGKRSSPSNMKLEDP